MERKLKPFEFLDITTADIAFIAYGKDLDRLFSNAALAMFEVMIGTKGVKAITKRKVNAEGKDLESLMFSWLNKLLFYYGSENLAFSKFKVKVDGKSLKLSAECAGERIDPRRHEIKTEVKAATYHRMEIKKVGDVWSAQVILDI